MNINLQIDTRIFNDVYYPYLEDNTRTQIFYGGSSSGKSKFALGQRMILDVLQGRNYLVIRNTANTLRGSCYNEALEGIDDLKLSKLFSVNKSEMVITCQNGSQIMFKGLDNAEKLKSIRPRNGVITDLLIEEATETNFSDVKQLRRRLRGASDKPKRVILLFNPIMRTHWIFQEYFANVWQDGMKQYRDDNISILHTTYKDNLRFLEREDIKELEDETDQYFHDVYTLGKWGVLGDLIFKNWKIEDLTDIKNSFNYYDNGLDFGFANNPSAFIRNSTHNKKIYIIDEFYRHGMTNDLLAGELLSRMRKDERVYCDSAEMKSIQELRNHKVNAIAAMKGPGSVNFGIQWLQQHEIIIDRSCQNTINEFQQYQWSKDKDGNTTNIPVKKFDHLIDALRYSKSDAINSKSGYNTPKDVGVYIP